MTEDRTITWAFRIADDMSEGADEAADAADKASASTDTAKGKQKELQNEAENTNNILTKQQAKLALQVTVVTGLQGGVSGLTGGIQALGITSDETNLALQRINASFQIMGGTANLIKSLQLAMTLLNVATLKNVLLNTYNAVVSNPAAIALVGAGAGAAITAAVILGAQSSSSSTTNITVNGTADQGTVATAQDLYTIVQGTI
ncbi:MAG: hypothetical protein WCR24_04000 [Candidatus Methanomethylophilaceae archaeon]